MKTQIYRFILIALGFFMAFGATSCNSSPKQHLSTKISCTASHVKHDGIDVSHYQGKIDWELVAKEPRTQFAIVKATEGATRQDTWYKKNVAEARKQGIKVGAYHMLSLITSPEAQVENFCKVVAKSKIDIIPAIDVEPALMRSKHSDRILRYTKRVSDLLTKRFGKRPIIYTTKKVYERYLKNQFSGHILWIASYTRHCPCLSKGHVSLWQYKENGRIKGYANALDLSCFVNGTKLKQILLK